MSDDAVFCPTCETKMKVIQGASFVHENVLCYWRRKRCNSCGLIDKTIEVPASIVHLFQAAPASKDMN